MSHVHMFQESDVSPTYFPLCACVYVCAYACVCVRACVRAYMCVLAHVRASTFARVCAVPPCVVYEKDARPCVSGWTEGSLAFSHMVNYFMTGFR